MDVQFANNFSHSVGCLLLIVMQKFFSLMYLFIFAFVICTFSVISKNHCQGQSQGAFSLCFLLEFLCFQLLHWVFNPFQFNFCEWYKRVYTKSWYQADGVKTVLVILIHLPFHTNFRIILFTSTLFFLAAFRILSLFLAVRNLIMLCLIMDFFEFILSGIHSASWISVFVSTNSGSSQSLFLQVGFFFFFQLCPLSPLLLRFHWL